MADNVPITAGAGTSVATDDVVGVHYQRVKLVDGTADSAALIPGDATNGLDVDVTRIAAGDTTIGRVKLTDGTDVALVTAGGLLQVDASGAAVPVTDNAGSLTIDAPVGTPVATRISDGAAFIDPRVGSLAHDAANGASNNPKVAGGEAVAHGANPTAVAAADVTKWYFSRAGVPFVIGGHPNIITNAQNFTAIQTDVALVTVAAGLKIVVTLVQVTADNANTVSPSVKIGFGAVSVPASGAGIILWHPGVPPGGGATYGSAAGIVGVGADGEDLRLTMAVPTGGSISVSFSYYTIES